MSKGYLFYRQPPPYPDDEPPYDEIDKKPLPPPVYTPHARNTYINTIDVRLKDALDKFNQNRTSDKKTDLEQLGAVGGLAFDIPEKHDTADARYVNGRVMILSQSEESPYMHISPDSLQRGQSMHQYARLGDVANSHQEATDNELNEEMARAPRNIYQSR